MNQNQDIVDKAIEALKKERAAWPLSENTIDTTKALLAEEQEKNQTKPREKTNIIKKLTSEKNLAKTAIAAVFLLVAILGIALVLTINQKPQTPTAQKINVAEPRQDELPETETKPVQDSEQKLQRELQNIRTMVAESDIDGLLDMLRSDREETKVAAAYYLGRIGDLSTVYALKQKSRKLAPEDPNNPFERAAREIIKRSGLEEFIANLTPEEKIELHRKLFAPKGVLSGLVLDTQTGEPIEDAEVSIHHRDSHLTRTDANGFYHFDEIDAPGNYKISIWSDPYIGIYEPEVEPVVGLSNKTRTVKHFYLKPACMLQLQVLNEENKPLENVRLIPTSMTDEHEIGPKASSRKTDANGLMLLGGFKPAGSPYLITAMYQKSVRTKTPAPFSSLPAGYAPAKLTVTLNNPEAIEFSEIVMKKGTTVKGYAEYADGVPAGGLKIGAKPDWWHCYSGIPGSPIDANGYFQLEHIVPGIYDIEIHIPAGAGMTRVPTVMQTKLPLEDKLLTVKLPQKSPGALASISGKVIFLSDKRPDYIDISAYSPESGHNNVNLSPKQNTFTIDSLEPGDHRLTFSGSNVERKVIDNVEAPTKGLEVTLRYLAKPKLRGGVYRAETKKPIQHFKIRARKVKGLHGNRYTQSDRWVEFNDPNGSFYLELVGPGIYQVQADALGFAPSWSKQINTDVNELALIELNSGGSIKGRVINEAGEPVSGAKVMPLSKAAGTSYRLKDVFVSQAGGVETQNGQFILEHLPAGKETLKVTHPDYSYNVVKDIEVTESRITEDILITLTEGGAAEGVVYDSQGLPQREVILRFQDDSARNEQTGHLATAVTDSNGFYRVTNLPEKICYIQRNDSATHLGVVKRTFLPTSGQTTRIDFGGEPVVSGQLVIDGEPLANTKMQLGGLDNVHSGMFRCFALTDPEGRFSFAGATPGRHAVYYQAPQKQNQWLKVANIEVGTENMELGIVPELSSTLSVYIETDSNDPNLALSQLYLNEGTELWGQRAGLISKPADPNEPYLITTIQPGQYTLTASRTDNVMIRQQIKVTKEKHNVTMDISGTCTLAGKISGGRGRAAIWRKDRKVLVNVKPDEDGKFKIENLPAGQYSVGGNMMLDIGILLTFNLAEGESKSIDIDTSEFANLSLATLNLQPLTENGVPIPGTETWLENNGTVVEPIQKQFFLVEPGQYTLHVIYPGFKEFIEPVFLEQRDSTESYFRSVKFIRLERK